MAAVRPNFRKYVMAVNRVERLLREVTDALENAAVPYAVVGGNAVAAWVATVDEGAVRSTKDVDILVRRPDLSHVTDALRPVGLMPVEVHGVMMYLDRRRPNPKTGVHVLFAKELIRPHDKHTTPDPAESVRAAGGFSVINLPCLLTMKLQAYRDIDRVHIRDLMSMDLIGAGLVGKLPADLRKRMRDIQATE